MRSPRPLIITHVLKSAYMSKSLYQPNKHILLTCNVDTYWIIPIPVPIPNVWYYLRYCSAHGLCFVRCVVGCWLLHTNRGEQREASHIRRNDDTSNFQGSVFNEFKQWLLLMQLCWFTHLSVSLANGFRHMQVMKLIIRLLNYLLW